MRMLYCNNGPTKVYRPVIDLFQFASYGNRPFGLLRAVWLANRQARLSVFILFNEVIRPAYVCISTKAGA